LLTRRREMLKTGRNYLLSLPRQVSESAAESVRKAFKYLLVHGSV